MKTTTEIGKDQPAGDLFYYAEGKKVPLTLSHRFVAVRPAQQAASTKAALSVAEALTTPTQLAQVIDLPEYGLAVITVSGKLGEVTKEAVGSMASVASVRAAVETNPNVTLGPPVYEGLGAIGQDGIIPIGEILVKFMAGTTEGARNQILDKGSLQISRADYPEPGTFLVKAQDKENTIALANKLHEEGQVEFAQPNFVHLVPRLNAKDMVELYPALAEASTSLPAKELLRDIHEAAAFVPAIAPAAPPTDPAYASQWNLRKIKAPEAFDITMGNPAISIAIIDEGVDLAHEDLTLRLPGYDAYEGDNNPQPSGSDAHGTACAGIAAAKANNAKGGAGVAPNCKVLPVRIARGVPGGWSTTDAIIADGIRTAVNRGADVLSNSWGGGLPSTVITNAFNYAQTNGRGGKGCPIATATGNSDARGVIYPARLSPSIRGLLAVGASNEWDQRKSKTSLDGENWWGSNYGPEVDVVAPGVHIYSPDIMGSAGYGSGNYVPNFNGTSSATPHVAGLMALILSVDTDLRSWEVEDIIKLTVDDLGSSGRDEQFGFGRINCRRALEAASRIWYEVSIVPQFIGTGRECFMRMNVRMYNPGINTVRLDGLTITSHNPTWTAEIDRLEHRPNPGEVMAPRSGHDLRLNGILLKANGNQSAWSYRWALNWSYTFWRPSAPGFPLSAGLSPTDSAGQQVLAKPVRGMSEGQRNAGAVNESEMMLDENGRLSKRNTDTGDYISVERQSRGVTIVIR